MMSVNFFGREGGRRAKEQVLEGKLALTEYLVRPRTTLSRM